MLVSIYTSSMPRNFSVKKGSILKCTNLDEIKLFIQQLDQKITHHFKELFLSSLDESKAKLSSQNSILAENEYVYVFQISFLSIEKEEHSISDLIDLAVKIKSAFGSAVFFKLFNPEYFLLKENSVYSFVSACISFLSLKEKKEFADKIILKLAELKLFKEFDRVINSYLESCRKNTRNIEEIINDFKKLNPEISPTFFDSLQSQYLQVLKYEEEIKSISDFQLQKTCSSIRERCENKKLKLQDKLYLLAAASLKIQKEFGIYPHSTQILTVLALTSPLSAGSKGCIAQVKTGEGKSIINTILALYFAMEGKCVDIITSAQSLATRDQEKFKKFFKMFGIKTSHICDQELTKNHFSGQIIYGINTDFEFSLLREQTGSQKVRAHFLNTQATRPCEVVLVDEVDNLFVDKSSNPAVIAIPNENKQHSVLGFVFNLIKGFEKESNLPDIEKLCETIRKSDFRDELLSKIFPTISDIQLKIFIKNAIKALWHMSEKNEYIIRDKDNKIDGKKVIEKEIVIVDLPTGALNEGSRWPDGLHEFVELKHEILLQEETLTFASLCHPVFFEKYSEIYGLTGTLGTQAERKEIEFVYRVNTIYVPTYSPSKRVTLEPVICKNEDDFQKILLQDISAMQKAGRPVLILCQTIEDVVSVEKLLFEKKFIAHTLKGKQLLSERFILSHAGAPCTITIATNLASRGTDIILTPESMQNGGLHVILTYFPDSERVEDQAIGRAGRQGQPGSSRIIIPHNDPSLSLFNGLSIQGLIKNMMINVSIKTYKDILLVREQKINALSANRTFRSNIEKLNHTYSELFFTAFGTLNDTLTDEFFENLMKENSLKYTNANLQKAKKNVTEQLKIKWSKFFSNLNQVIEKIIEELQNSISNYSIIEEAYTKRTRDLFEVFKNEHTLFFTNPREYFLSLVPNN